MQVAEGTQGKGITHTEDIFAGGHQDINVTPEDKKRAQDELAATGPEDVSRAFMLQAEARRGTGGFRSA